MGCAASGLFRVRVFLSARDEGEMMKQDDYDKLPLWVLVPMYLGLQAARHLTTALCCAMAWFAYISGQSPYIIGIWLMMGVVTLPEYRKSDE
jgi:hypothetical protein